MEDNMEIVVKSYLSLYPQDLALDYRVSNLMEVCWVNNKHTAAIWTVAFPEKPEYNTDPHVLFYIKSLTSRISDRHLVLNISF